MSNGTQPPPLPPYGVPYHPTPPRDPRARAKFLQGLAVGVLLSILMWAIVYATPLTFFLLIVPGGKAIAALVCLIEPRWRPIGLGLITSFGVGFLILSGICYVDLVLV